MTPPNTDTHRSLRGVSHTFYTTLTSEVNLVYTPTDPPACIEVPQVQVAVIQALGASCTAERFRFRTTDVFWDLLLLLSLTGGASVAPKHGLHDGATASTLIFR